MAIYQPSNVIPSSFAGAGLGVVDVNNNILISWQVNGNSPMTAFRIQIYNNASSNESLVKETEIISLSNPFYGTDNKGNPQQFSTSEYIKDTTWANWGLSNGNEYKMVITQYWGSGRSNSIEQWSGSVFITQETPSVSIAFSPELNAEGQGAFANQGFTASVTPESTLINSVRWQFGSIDGVPADGTVIEDSLVTILDDTGAINTSVLEYAYDGLFSGNTYAIKCAVETHDGLTVSTGWQAFEVNYVEAKTSAENEIAVECLADDSVLLSWAKAKNIQGEISPSGTQPTVKDGLLLLNENETVTWDKIDDEAMNIEPPYTVAWKGELCNWDVASIPVELKPAVSSRIITEKDDTESNDIVANGNTLSFDASEYFENGEYVITSQCIYGGCLLVVCEGYTPGYKSYDHIVIRYNLTKKTSDVLERINYSQVFIAVCGDKCAIAYTKESGYIYTGVVKIYYPNWTYKTWEKSFSGNLTYIMNVFALESEQFLVVYKYGGYYIAFCFLSLVGIDLSNSIESYVYVMQADSSFIPISIFSFAETQDVLLLWGAVSLSTTYCYKMKKNEKEQYCLVSKEQVLIDDTIPVSPVGASWFLGQVAYSKKLNIYVSGKNSSGTCAYSYDGVNWKTYNGVFDYPIFVEAANMFVAGNTSENKICYSYDGVEWCFLSVVGDGNMIVAPNITLPLYQSSSHNHFVCYGYGQYYIVNSDNKISDCLILFNFNKKYDISGWFLSLVIEENSSWIMTTSMSQETVNEPLTVDYSCLSRTLPSTLKIKIIEKSAMSTGSATLTVDGFIGGANLSSISGGSSNSETSFTEHDITVKIEHETPSRDFESLDVVAYVDYLFTQNKVEYPKTLFEAGGFSIDIVKASIHGSDYYTKDWLAIQFENTKTGSWCRYNIRNSKRVAGMISAILELATDATQVIFIDASGYADSRGGFVLKVDEPITSLKLTGKQACDWLYIGNGDIDIDGAFSPKWTEDTLFLADFSSERDALQAGTFASGGSIVNALYRIDEGDNALKPIYSAPTNINRLKDYGLRSGKSYAWELFYLDGDNVYSTPIKSSEVCKQLKVYSLIEASQDKDFPNVYHVVKVWRFGNNLSVGGISNNNTPNWLTNFTPYRLRQPSSRLGQSGTLQALLSNYNRSENFYKDTVEMMDELKQASASLNTFFLKDMKGNLYMVGISGPITQTVSLKSKIQEVTISVPWEEVGDATNVSLIQLPTDEGWLKDQVFEMKFNANAETGILSAEYPENYVGTTFEINDNEELTANTPLYVAEASFELENGQVIAEVKTES